MAENRIFVENLTDPVAVTLNSPGSTSNDPLVVSIVDDPNSVYVVRNPGALGVNSFSLANISGVVAANVFLALFNPVGSGRVLLPFVIAVSSATAGNSTATEPLRGHRISAASGGTLQPVSALAKNNTSEPDSVAEVRTGNPTVTLGVPMFNSPPPISLTNVSQAVHDIVVPPDSGGILLAPGEGLAFRTASGTTNQRWNLTLVWGEA